ncbi:MAG TPA: type II secretion system protein [Verrucomicrobiota bacterium]|nr:type II secretion system protein [Verrucomicrobiota bacterium]
MVMRKKNSSAFTLIELLVVIFTVVIIAAFVIPALLATKGYARRISCTNNLKHISLSFRIWANDYSDNFPWMVDPKDGGAKGLGIERQFLVASKEIGTPKVCSCPSDSKREPALDWDMFASNGIKNISYFYSPDVINDKPKMIFFGDRNIDGRPKTVSKSEVRTSTNDLYPKWDKTIHKNSGNISFGDGIALQTINKSCDFSLARQFEAEFQSMQTNNLTTIRIVYPE